MLAFKKNSPFRSCISKINSKFIGNAEDLDITKPMYNMLEIKRMQKQKSLFHLNI